MEWDSVDFCLFRFSVAYSYRLRVITLSRMLHVFLTLCLSAQKSCRRVFLDGSAVTGNIWLDFGGDPNFYRCAIWPMLL